MQSFRGGMPVGRSGALLVALIWVGMIMPLRFGLINAFTLALAAFALLTLPIFFVRSRIEVAADGIFLRWLWWRRFIAFERIEGTWYDPGRVASFGKRARNAVLTLALRDGKPLEISGRSTSHDLGRAREAIDRGLVDYRGVWNPIPFDGARLSRGDADAKAWLDRLRALVKKAETFRDAPPTHDELARIVDDAHATEEHRAAAAVALAATGNDGKAHLRVARDSTADPKLRVAFDAALSDDDLALADALGEIRDDDRGAAS